CVSGCCSLVTASCASRRQLAAWTAMERCGCSIRSSKRRSCLCLHSAIACSGCTAIPAAGFPRPKSISVSQGMLAWPDLGLTRLKRQAAVRFGGLSLRDLADHVDHEGSELIG